MTVAAPALPPGPRLPGIVQGLRYAHDPIGFFTRLRRRHGNVFSLSFPYFGRVVYVADPAIVKLFSGEDVENVPDLSGQLRLVAEQMMPAFEGAAA